MTKKDEKDEKRRKEKEENLEEKGVGERYPNFGIISREAKKKIPLQPSDVLAYHISTVIR